MTDRRADILRAATELFARYGFRRASVDQIAAAAGVAKPTVYAYFADKSAVFRAVCEHVMDDIVARGRAAAAGPGPLADRLAEVLAAKFTSLFALVGSSPHAAELMDSQGRLGADVVQKGDRAFVRVLAGVVGAAVEAGAIDPSRAGLTPASLVQTLMRAGHGAAYGSTTAAQHRRHLDELVRAIVAGVEVEAAAAR